MLKKGSRPGTVCAAVGSILPVPAWFPAIPLEARKVAHEGKHIRLFKGFNFFLRVNGNKSGIALIVAVHPMDPLVPFEEIKLAAFTTFVQRANQVATILVGFHLVKEFAEFVLETIWMLPQDAFDRGAQMSNLDLFLV
jgi:hypothetical protein